METIHKNEILDIRSYERERHVHRQQAREAKTLRTLELGPFITMTFQSREAVLYDFQEYLRSRRIREEDAIEEALGTYNRLLPEDGQLGATLLVTPPEEDKVAGTLHKFSGLSGEDILWLESGRQGSLSGNIIPLGDDTNSRHKIVYMVRFPIQAEWPHQGFDTENPLILKIQYHSYQAETPLGNSLKRALLSDLNLRDDDK